MTVTSEPTVTVTPESLEAARRRVTPKRLAWLNALTDDDIAAMVAADPDAAPALDDPVFDKAVWVRPLKDAAE